MHTMMLRCVELLKRVTASSSAKRGKQEVSTSISGASTGSETPDVDEKPSNNTDAPLAIKFSRTDTMSCDLDALPELCLVSPATIAFEHVQLKDLELLGILGIGTYGVVKLARHRPSGRAVALKVISKEYIVSMRQEKHIVRERFVHMRLRHPFVTTLYQTLQDDNCLYLVLEYLPGGELYTVVHSETKSPIKLPQGGLPMAAVRFYAACIVLALEYLHAQGTIYRDLKLENLVLDALGYPKVLDFGFAKPDGVATRNGTMCGSLDYMAPEIVSRNQHDQRADVWSFGILLYELCIGSTPFSHPNTREQMRCINEEPVSFPNGFEEEHPDVCSLINRCLEKAPSTRVSSMRAIKAHRFFAGTLWHKLLAHEVDVPFVPELHGAFDTSRFDFAPEDPDEYVEPYESDGDDWAKDF
ncbi:AGC/PKA protein kinase [Saprolegnia parasitica CBS 223.65]|uniref:AGC/PKA protein kinase n=1 Tax=Saprolegnia parasitica (strain CBS 223.65) TaxID=695850 RepID=A0A067CCA9_SAPPC|nr:AGC/PKA protein kinase [Saprolegnia parasitica CBS 223.65]KDO28399.1 AGC/PKA protein kinase [Saprolegnia parasitica CBS 223.65]|eukprot:XP_012200841.1 AGC/PKA protein kinase [Saprolegnia parasitica CBS 223.65]